MTAFLDRVAVAVRAGDGGKGSISFRREAHVPRGGPDGGDGGNGGDVVLRVDPLLGTLSDLRFKRSVAAASGADGSGRQRSGKSAPDLVLRIPPGTVVTDAASGDTVADLVAAGQEIVVARGGRGGRGNARFATSVRRAPRIAEDGTPGESRDLVLELKLIADVGLAGLPNAGKSTLLAALTRSRPKIAAYPFTTLVPNLGVATHGERELIVADIPGLIEGAHHGAGLGEDFLRHIERTRLVVHVVDCALPDPLADMAIIEVELTAYGHGLVDRPRIVALNKMDLPEAREAAPKVSAALEARGLGSFAISAASGTGVPELLRAIFTLAGEREPAAVAEPTERRIAFAGSGRDWSVTREGPAYRVKAERLERLASGIDWHSPDASVYFMRIVARSGVEKELRKLGVKEGDTVRVGTVELEWHEPSE